MGNTSPSLRGLDPRFQELGIDDNQLLSTLIVVKDSNTQEKLLIKQINIASETDYSRLLKELRQRKVLSTKKIGKYLLRVRDVEGRQQSQICGKSFKLLVYLEYVSGSLKTVFQERFRTRRCFEEDELIGLMKGVVSGLIMLHDNSFKNIHLCKESILVTCENTYKIMDTQLCNRIHPFFEVLNGVPPKSGTYLAPQFLNDIFKETAEFYQTPKADLFTLAVIVLELATLRTMDSYYDYEKKQIDLQGLRKMVDQLPMAHFFKDILHDMLQEQEEERIGLLSLRERLSGGIDTQTNEELCAFNSMSQISNAKQSARTFISLSKKGSRPQSIHQPSKDNSIQMPANQQISQYITQMQHKIPQPQPPGTFNSANLETARNKPFYVPIEANFNSRPSNISVNGGPPFNPFQNTSIQTPKSQVIHQLKIVNTRQFDTPVNFLLQPYPESVSRQPPQENIKEESPEGKDDLLKLQGNKKIDMISSKAISSKSQIVFSKNEVFNNKSYGQLEFGNGARYEGEFNQQGEFEGNGILYYPNCNPCYSGSWKGNSFHGFGVLHNEHPPENSQKETPYWEFKLQEIDWLYYEGEFSMDRKEGFGTLYMVNGDKFSGCFKDDAIEGFGSFYNSKQQKNINGIWMNNVIKH